MKQHQVAKVNISTTAKQACLVAVSILTIGGITVGYFEPLVRADRFDDQIKALELENQRYHSKAEQLRVQAASLAEELAKIDAEKAAIQAQIDESTKQLDSLKLKIAKTEKQIDDNREALGQVINEIYLAGQITPLERLASSKSLTAYIDEEASRENLQSSLHRKVKEINTFKDKLENQKKDVENVLKSQAAQKAQWEEKENAKQAVLQATQGDEASYRNLASANNSRISQLRADQAEEMRRQSAQNGVNIPAGIPGGGGYPGQWANAPLDAYVDPWGLYTRECVSYAAWKVWSTGRYVPHFGGRGNANQWPSTAAAYGIPNGRTPRQGAVAVWYIGYYGHVMYVEAVHSDGSITVSDYNLQWDGLYRRYHVGAATARSYTYIYF